MFSMDELALTKMVGALVVTLLLLGMGERELRKDRARKDGR